MESAFARYRTAATDDIPGILELMQDYYAEDRYPFDPDLSRQSLRQLAADPQLGSLWVAAVGPRIVGYLAITLGYSLEYGGRDAFIDELFIARGYRGAGLGKEAIELAVQYCRSENVRALHLEVEKKRRAAARLYERAGFERHDRTLMTLSIDVPAQFGA